MDWEKYVWIIYLCIIILLCMVICYIGHEKKIRYIVSNKIKPKKPENTLEY